MFHMWDFGLESGTGWWMGLSGIWMLVFWSGIIAFGIWFVRKLVTRKESHRERDAMSIARERYARGDISKEEFDNIQRTLNKY